MGTENGGPWASRSVVSIFIEIRLLNNKSSSSSSSSVWWLLLQRLLLRWAFTMRLSERLTQVDAFVICARSMATRKQSTAKRKINSCFGLIPSFFFFTWKPIHWLPSIWLPASGGFRNSGVPEFRRSSAVFNVSVGGAEGFLMVKEWRCECYFFFVLSPFISGRGFPMINFLVVDGNFLVLEERLVELPQSAMQPDE